MDDYDVDERRRMKQASRDEDARRLSEAVAGPQGVSAVNCLFSPLDRSKARVLQRRVRGEEP